MNDYMRGTIDTCRVLSRTKKEFLLAISKATGMTSEGIEKHKYIQEILVAWGKQ